MGWDLGLRGFGLLVGMSLAFGVVAQVWPAGATTRWMWAIASVTFLISGVLISEGWFGWATAEELKPNYDGLSFDETLLSAVPGAIVVWLTKRRLRRHRSRHRFVPRSMAR